MGTYRLASMNTKLRSIRQSPSLFLKTFMNDIANKSFFKIAPPTVLFPMAMSNAYLYQMIQPYWNRAFSYRRCLRPFIPVYLHEEFWEMLSLTGALISGSFPLQYFTRTLYPDSDLDLYCEDSRAGPLIKFLLQNGWDITRRCPGTYANPCVRRIQTFEQEDAPEPKRRIQVMSTNHAPFEAILHFHSSVAFNVITPIYAICLYPMETLEEDENVLFDNGHIETESYQNAITKYESRGWKAGKRPSVLTFMNARGGFSSMRAVGDRLCFIMPGPVYNSIHDSDAATRLQIHSYEHNISADPLECVEILHEGIDPARATNPTSFCFPRGQLPFGFNDVRCVHLLKDKVHATVRRIQGERNKLLGCFYSRFIRDAFRLHEQPLDSPVALSLVRLLYPFYTYFRYHPQLKLIFDLSQAERARGLRVKVIVLWQPQTVQQCSIDVFDLTELEPYTTQAFEIITTDETDEFLFRHEPTGRNLAPVLPYDTLGEGDLHLLRRKRARYENRITNFVRDAVQERRGQGGDTAREMDDKEFDELSVNVVSDYLFNLVWFMDAGCSLKREFSDVDSPIHRGPDTPRFITIYFILPEEWLAMEVSPYRFAPARILQQQLAKFGFRVVMCTETTVWM
ncbi:hypothetical protein PM082_004816 [Marasmius tenuissimus]|nr:hypothetical protein PM082_004816 [Marasmius tenuissimus]